MCRRAFKLTDSGRLAEAALLCAAIESARGDDEAACATLHRLLEQAPPGPVGWMIPIDPSLQSLRKHKDFARLASLLALRAS